MSKRAIILAGGKGTRLQPYTLALPKPLMPVGDFPILEIIIRQLVKYGFDHITLAVNHQADIIKAYFQNGNRWDVKIDYSLETVPIGTVAPLGLVKDLPENFLFMNGDILTDFNDNHIKNKNIFTVASQSRTQKIDYGVLEVDSNGYLTKFKEKPVSTHTVSMGIYMANIQIKKFFPNKQKYGFDNLMLDLISAKKPASIWEYDGYWLDIGRPDDYIKATEEFDQMKSRFLIE